MNSRSAPEWVLTTHGANQLAHLLRHARPPRLTVSDLPRPEQAKAFAVPADDGRGFDDKDAGLPVVPDGAEPSPEEPIRRCQFRSLDGALQNAELMAECEDLELQRRPAPEGSEKRGQKSGQYLPERESKEEGQLPVYQSDRIFREPQSLEDHHVTFRSGRDEKFSGAAEFWLAEILRVVRFLSGADPVCPGGFRRETEPPGFGAIWLLSGLFSALDSSHQPN